MYKIGESVVYGSEGVCEVENIKKLNISEFNKDKTYYILKPMHENGKVFVPVDTNVFIREVLKYEEIQTLIEVIPTIEKSECDIKGVKVLQDHYKKLLKHYECIDLLTELVSLNEKKNDLIKNKKKLNQIDDRFMKIAKGLLEDEFSIVLGIPKEDVEAYIIDKLNKQKYGKYNI